MKIKTQKIKNDYKFTLDNGKTLYAYKGDYAITHNREIYIVKKMTWGSKTTGWIAFHSEQHEKKFKGWTLQGLKESMNYYLNQPLTETTAAL